MKTYTVKLVSQRNAIILIFLLLAFFLISGIALLPKTMSTFSSTICVAIDFVISYFLWQKFVTGKTEWTVDDLEIKIIWTKKFTLADNKDFNFKWTEIENIKRGIDPQYYNLQVKLVSGQIIKFFHDTLTTKDDFEDLLKILYKKLNDKKATANNRIADQAGGTLEESATNH